MVDDSREKVSQEAVVPRVPVALSADALARRKMLLKSLGKGSAVLAAASVPMHSLAAIGTLSVTANGQRCTMSGTQSGVHSRETVTDVCSGFARSKYKTLSNWPGTRQTVGGVTHVYNTVDGITFNEENTIRSLFSGYGTSGLLSKLNSAPDSNQAVWITALLNALNPAAETMNYPYTASEVRALYNDPLKRDAALAFFKGYMQTVL